MTTKTKGQQAILYAESMSSLSPEERKTTVNRLEQAAQAQTKISKQVTETIHHTIDNRIGELNFNQLFGIFDGVGVASGDDSNRKLQSVWVRGVYSSSKQSGNKGTAGYKGNISGGTVGADFELNEQNIVGIAYSNMRSSFKYKQTRIGDKINGNSHILSLYSAHQLNDNFLLKTIFSAGKSRINSKRLVMDKITVGKIKSTSYSAETSVSYNIATKEHIHFIPNIGIRYGHYKDGAYSEHGAGVQNASIDAKSNNTLTAITGVSVLMPQKISETLLIVPSVQSSVESHLNNKKQKVKAKLAWMDHYFENNANAEPKSARFSYNLGGGVLIKHNSIEVSADYNCNLHKKYQNHYGAVKLKILF